MTEQDVLDTYPHCRTAVAYTEGMLCVPCDGEKYSSWDLMMNTKNPMTLDEVIEMIQNLLRSEVEEGNACRASDALEQSNHPSYRTYIAAKMGMM